MRVTSDTVANALYVYVREGKYRLTETINELNEPGGLVNVDRDADGNVLGIEFVPNTVIQIEDITGKRRPGT